MHKPVMVKEILSVFAGQQGGVYIDGTIGGGGHTEAILKAIPESIIYGIDRDQETLSILRAELKSYIDARRLFLFHSNFKDLPNLLSSFTVKIFQGALLDLGFSSLQLDDEKRGFSFQKEGPLDMRMDQFQDVTAADLIHGLNETELANLFYQLGEERFSRRIASAIVRRRTREPFRNTLDLANFIAVMVPDRYKRKIHPATKVFQALRIAVNQELEGLAEALQEFMQVLSVGGRLAVISFHSLEDRIVKQVFNRFENPCICPTDFPQCVCGKKKLGKRITKKPWIPASNEILMNPRARSAKLRVVEKIV